MPAGTPTPSSLPFDEPGFQRAVVTAPWFNDLATKQGLSTDELKAKLARQIFNDNNYDFRALYGSGKLPEASVSEDGKLSLPNDFKSASSKIDDFFNEYLGVPSSFFADTAPGAIKAAAAFGLLPGYSSPVGFYSQDKDNADLAAYASSLQAYRQNLPTEPGGGGTGSIDTGSPAPGSTPSGSAPGQTQTTGTSPTATGDLGPGGQGLGLKDPTGITQNLKDTFSDWSMPDISTPALSYRDFGMSGLGMGVQAGSLGLSVATGGLAGLAQGAISATIGHGLTNALGEYESRGILGPAFAPEPYGFWSSVFGNTPAMDALDGLRQGVVDSKWGGYGFGNYKAPQDVPPGMFATTAPVASPTITSTPLGPPANYGLTPDQFPDQFSYDRARAAADATRDHSGWDNFGTPGYAGYGDTGSPGAGSFNGDPGPSNPGQPGSEDSASNNM